MLWYVLAFLIGLLLASVWAWYIRTVAAGSAIWATVSDVALLVLTFSQYQLWSYLNNDWRIFAAIVLGTIPGTYFATKGRK